SDAWRLVVTTASFPFRARCSAARANLLRRRPLGKRTSGGRDRWTMVETAATMRPAAGNAVPMLETALVAFTTYVATIGPADVAALFAALTPDNTPAERRRMAVRGTLIATIILLVFALFGETA